MPINPVSGKIEAQEINNNLSYLESAIKNIDKGTPKGVYSTISALNSAFPSGDSGVYVVSADGKWYFWNGSSWVPGGVYQSVTLSDNSVTREKLSPIVSGFNNLSTGVIYNGDGSVNKVRITDGSTIFEEVTLNFNTNGVLTSVVETNQGKTKTVTTTLNYDASGNLTSTSNNLTL